MALTLVLAALVTGAAVYCVLTLVAARRYLAVAPPETPGPGISVLKPLHGSEPRLYENLRSFFEQDYADFEILFAVNRLDDAAVPVVERLRAAFPQVAARLIETGPAPYANDKVFKLDRMRAAARYDLLVMSDSDIRMERDALARIGGEFNDPALGMATCPYRAAPGGTFWSLLEALGLNTQFLGGVLVARMLEGMRFALGPTIAARKPVLSAIGGLDALKDYLAEDFVMGNRAAALGHGVILSSCVIEHHIGGQGFRNNLMHRLRWCRSTRRSRPYGYLGEIFTMPLPLALALWAWAPAWWHLVAATCVLRALSAWACAGWVLRDPLTARYWWLLPLQDLLAFAVWCAGFFGNTIVWRGRRYRLQRDGTFEAL